MRVLNAINETQGNDIFKDWHKKNPECYLAHVLTMDAEREPFQIGYYNPKTSRMVTFVPTPSGLEVMEEAEVFKKEEAKVRQLNIDDIKFDIDHALETADSLQKEHYPSHAALKRIVILQHLKEGPVYNITYVTMAFSVLNIRVRADDGKVESHKLTNIIDTGKSFK